MPASDPNPHGVVWYGFWGFFNNSLAVVLTFFVLLLSSLFKVVVSAPVTSFIMLVGLFSFYSNMRRAHVPKYLDEFVGILWPLSLTWQALFGVATGIVAAFAQQQFRLHVHHDWEVDGLRYAGWVLTVLLTCFLQSLAFGVLCNCGPDSFKLHSE
eukprot:TRINITY_DN21493_c0_g1_i2.p1 TRINITY_DN21493_c0_g1~~TRINITY_DN21493_c0_g1_i2.p1  ORF type:complete len:155 (+),score=27.30 TRINITY_DN21493_c0_g1_i2:48-512(+)